MTQTQKIVFELVHKAIDPEYELNSVVFVGADWNKVYRFAMAHSLSHIAFEALGQLPRECRPDKRLLMNWYGQVSMQEGQYEQKWQVACELADLWAKEGVSALVLKGRSIAQYYPVPSHRCSCDLDLFIEEGWDRACTTLEAKGIKLVYEVYKEAEFSWKGVYVECHRYITPVRGNQNLSNFELYLRSMLQAEPTNFFKDSLLIQPPLMFTVFLCLEHALWDFLHGVLTLKHLVDWMVLRRQNVDWKLLDEKCGELKFDRFLRLINTLVDVIEGKQEYEELPPSYQRAFDEIMHIQSAPKKKVKRSWFKRRVLTAVEIIESRRRYAEFGYCSMLSFLINSTWTHFFEKEVKL